MAQKLNIIVDQGTTFVTYFYVNGDDGLPINFSGYTGRSKIKKSYTSANSVSFSVNCDSTGLITLSLSANTTTNLVSGRYVYDVEVVDSSNQVSRIVEGIVTVTPQVTT